jgi:hypothetical protein
MPTDGTVISSNKGTFTAEISQSHAHLSSVKYPYETVTAAPPLTPLTKQYGIHTKHHRHVRFPYLT